jgi:CHAD domain-containing protein
MSFEVESGETVSHAVRRIARHEIDGMLAELRAGPGRRDAVHEARKSSKKLRALVRLVRDEIGEKTYRLENATFRDAVRPLSSVRDAEALVRSLDLLAERFAEEVRPRTFGRLRKVLPARLRALRKAAGTRAAMRHAAALVARARSRVGKWTIRHDGWEALERGVARIYARARAARRCAVDDPSVEHLHEWRKRSKDLRYVLELLEPIWPPVMKAFAGQTHELTDHLGDDHDLAELERLVLAEPDSCGAPEDCAAVIGLIDVRRAELRARALRLGARLYVEKPRAFVVRLRGYWAAWEEAERKRSVRPDRPQVPATYAA